MTKHQGGTSAASTKSQSSNRIKSRKVRTVKLCAAAIENLLPDHLHLISKRKVREIVTVGGRGVRGHFPSRKAKLLKYESLGEQDVLRVCEVARCVTRLHTQSCVFEFGEEGDKVRYTPDLTATIDNKNFYIEVKPEQFQKKEKATKHLRKVIRYMRDAHVAFILILASDVRTPGLQEELKNLLSRRPRPGRYDPKVDPTLWDPLQPNFSDTDLLDRWSKAQETCDALLERVMRRDPDSLLDVVTP